METVDFNRLRASFPSNSHLVLSRDPTEPPMLELSVWSAKIDSKPARRGTGNPFGPIPLKAYSRTYIADRVNCLSSDQLDEDTLLIKVTCPPGRYFMRRQHPDGVVDWYYAITVGGDPKNTHCGAPDHVPMQLDASHWGKYQCMDQTRAGTRWPTCLTRAAYSSSAGQGCPGEMLCCPGD